VRGPSVLDTQRKDDILDVTYASVGSVAADNGGLALDGSQLGAGVA
jgi:hypothetical protein